jgi:hypothetical protein
MPRINPLPHALSALLASLLVLTQACQREVPLHIRQKDVLSKADQFYQGYLDGGLPQARNSLVEAGKVLEDGRVLEPRGRAHLLFLNYCRLHRLEIAAGEPHAAEIALIKAHYWYSLSLGLAGESPKAMLEEIQRFDSRTVILMVDKTDRLYNEGAPPAYLKTIIQNS